MNPAIMLACLLLTPFPQEKPPKTDPAREAALEAIRNAKPVDSDNKTPAGSVVQTPESAPRGRVSTTGGTRTGANRQGTFTGILPSSSGARATAASIRVTETDKKASALFVANALHQQELAKRRQIVSIADINTPEAALAELTAGNERFAKGERVRTMMTAQEPELRKTLITEQTPFAVIVTCSDSHVMDNLIFDQELGRIFTIRVAGNIPDALGIASIEYALEYLGVKVVVVMGHAKCGVVGTVADFADELLPGNLYIFQALMDGLLDAVPRDPNESGADHKSRLENENAIRQAQAVYEGSKIVREFVDQGKIWLLPASYDIDSGKATFFRQVEVQPHLSSPLGENTE